MANVVDFSLDYHSLRKKLLILSKNDIQKICKHKNISYNPNLKKAENIAKILHYHEKNETKKTQRKKKKKKKTILKKSKRFNNDNKKKQKIVLKIGFLGDSCVGSKSLMIRYIENKFDEDYTETLGVNFMEKKIQLKNIDVIISCWFKGGCCYESMMPLVCSDAKCIVFIFDLTQKSSLYSVKKWYKQARKENKVFMPFLVGNKYDLYEPMNKTDKLYISKQARKFASKMSSPLIYCSCLNGINVKKIFKIIVAKVFDLNPKIKQKFNELKEPLMEIIQLNKYQKNCILHGYLRYVQQKYKWYNTMPINDLTNIMLLFL